MKSVEYWRGNFPFYKLYAFNFYAKFTNFQDKYFEIIEHIRLWRYSRIHLYIVFNGWTIRRMFWITTVNNDFSCGEQERGPMKSTKDPKQRNEK